MDLKSQNIEKSSKKSSSIVQNVRLKAKGVQFLGAHQSKMTEPRVKDDNDDDIMEYDSESDSEESKKSDIGVKAIETASNTGYTSEKLPSRVSTSKVVNECRNFICCLLHLIEI